MKILHVCLAAFYIDGYAYQENVLPRMHKLQGNEVQILASCETYIDNQKLGYIKPKSYINEDSILVTRIPYISFLPLPVAKKLRIYRGINEYLEKYQPDFIFLHDVQFLSIKSFIDYKKRHPNVTIVADGHTDYNNSAKTFISKNILHKFIYKSAIKRADKYIDKYYGTLPSRVEFFHSMYGIDNNKIQYLPFGVDDTKVKNLTCEDERKTIIEKLGIPTDRIIIVTGGKLDDAKHGVIDLVKAVNDCNGVVLLIFGSMSESIKKQYDEIRSNCTFYLGWLNEMDSSKILMGSDVAFFPYLHSTLWEQTAGNGTPLVVKYITGFDHININGNCIFLNTCSVDEIKEKIEYCKKNIEDLKNKAELAKATFEYTRISANVL